MISSIGHYQVIKQLGMGSAGEVYSARDNRLDRLVALKLLSDKAEEDLRGRFIQEAKAASALNHPNILTVFEAGKFENIDYIVMEYIEGGTLRELLKAGPLSLTKLLNIAIQIGTGLIAAHSANIIHRDIKPDNVMIRKDGIVKLLDFGLAKIKDRESAVKGGTKPGTLLGTVGYMSPEQVQGEAVDARADIFALGAVLYEMTTGRPPFRSDNPIDTMYAILKQSPAPIEDEELPPRLSEIIYKAIAKEQANRYQTAQEIVLELRQLQKQCEIQRVFEQASSLSPEKSAPVDSEQLVAAANDPGLLSQSFQVDMLIGDGGKREKPPNIYLPWILVVILSIVVVIESLIIWLR